MRTPTPPPVPGTILALTTALAAVLQTRMDETAMAQIADSDKLDMTVQSTHDSCDGILIKMRLSIEITEVARDER